MRSPGYVMPFVAIVLWSWLVIGIFKWVVPALSGDPKPKPSLYLHPQRESRDLPNGVTMTCTSAGSSVYGPGRRGPLKQSLLPHVGDVYRLTCVARKTVETVAPGLAG